MSRYAAGTSVPATASRTEIEKTLTRYGATSFAYGWDEDRAIIGFTAHNRQVRMGLPLPSPDDRRFTHTPQGRTRTTAQTKALHSQGVRAAWRALALVVKAKLAGVEAGVVTFEEEFAAHIVMPDGRTVSDHIMPVIDHAYRTGTMPPMLGLGPGTRDGP